MSQITETLLNIHMYIHKYKAVADGPVGQVLAGPLFLKVKQNLFYRKQVIN